MKKIFLSFTLMISAGVGVNAQLTSLSENFNVSCVLSSGFPSNWALYNPISGTAPAGAWTCGPVEGRNGTPGIFCTGTYGATDHLDTSYLLTPLLNVSSYTGKVFLRFDTKMTTVHSGGRLTALKADTNFVASGGAAATDLTDSIYPLIINVDSSGWVTHQIDLSWFETSPSFYIAFRYTSATTSDNIWYLDNINTTTENLLNVPNINTTELPLKVIGNATSGEMTISYSSEIAGTYNVAVYDMMGREVHRELINTEAGTFTHPINNLSLQPGMYLIKMGNEATYGTAKAVVY